MNDFEHDILKMLQHISKKEPFSNEFMDAVLLFAKQVDKHAELKAQYQRDVETCKAIDGLEAWNLWQCITLTGGFTKCDIPPKWLDQSEYRRHPHADLMIEYLCSDEQKKNRLQSRENENKPWITQYLPTWNDTWQYRFKPVITNNGKEYNAPLRDSKGIDGKYVYLDLNSSGFFVSVSEWENDEVDNKRLNEGLIFSSREDCQAVADAFNAVLRPT
jgi:hypothetical protein